MRVDYAGPNFDRVISGVTVDVMDDVPKILILYMFEIGAFSVWKLFRRITSSRMALQQVSFARSVPPVVGFNFDLQELWSIPSKGGGDDTCPFTAFSRNELHFRVLHLRARKEAFMEMFTFGVLFLVWMIAWDVVLLSLVSSCYSSGSLVKGYVTCLESSTRCSYLISYTEGHELPKITNEWGLAWLEVMMCFYLFYMSLKLLETCDTSTLTYGTFLRKITSLVVLNKDCDSTLTHCDATWFEFQSFQVADVLLLRSLLWSASQ